MSRLIEIDPSIEQIPEEDGHEYGYYAFDILPPMRTEKFEINKVNEDDKMDKELNVTKRQSKFNHRVSPNWKTLSNYNYRIHFCDNIIRPIK